MAVKVQWPGWVYRAATVYLHDAIMGLSTIPVRAYHVEKPRVYADGHVEMSVYCLAPRNRRRDSYKVDAKESKYITIEAGGDVLYDSRGDVPCDMQKWEVDNARFEGNRPLTVRRTVWTVEELEARRKRAGYV